jgi:uncharacterized protein YgiM (DUF1202 family)
MKKNLVCFLVLALAVAAGCTVGASPNGPSYVVVTMAMDTPVPFKPTTFRPTETRLSTPTRTSTLTPTATPAVGCVTVNSIFVRSGPGKNFPFVGGLGLGECVTVLAYSPDQLWVQFQDGWIATQYLNFTHQTIEQGLTIAAGATTTPTLTLIPTIKK